MPNYAIQCEGSSSNILVLESDVSHARPLDNGLGSNGTPHPSTPPVSLSILRKMSPPQLQQPSWLVGFWKFTFAAL